MIFQWMVTVFQVTKTPMEAMKTQMETMMNQALEVTSQVSEIYIFKPPVSKIFKPFLACLMRESRFFSSRFFTELYSIIRFLSVDSVILAFLSWVRPGYQQLEKAIGK